MTGARRLVLWGTGDVGSAVIRAIVPDPRFEIVGVRASGPHAHGVDVGTLAGIDPVGIRASISPVEALIGDPDCVVVTPPASARIEGVDDLVVELLAAGNNVVTTAAYTRFGGRGRRARAVPQRILAACHLRGTTVHGVGLVTAQAVRRSTAGLAATVGDLTHVRFIETADLAVWPERAGGHLDELGFGRPIQAVDDGWFDASVGGAAYDDLVAAFARDFFGVRSGDLRVERSVRAVPARRDLHIGAIQVRAGTAVAIEVVHRVRAHGEAVVTHEIWWHLGHAESLPGEASTEAEQPTAQTYELSGTHGVLRGSLSWPSPGTGAVDPLTVAAADALLAAVDAVVEGPPGILVDDPARRYRIDAGPLAGGRASRQS